MKALPRHSPTAVRERERQRIARDIHDGMGQSLLALKLDLSSLQGELAGATPHARERVALMIHNLDASLLALRGILFDLQPPPLQGGLAEGARLLLAELTRVSGMTHKLSVQQQGSAYFGQQQDAVAFRVLQEALTNVVRHAHARHVDVLISRTPTSLELRVRDDGDGFDLASHHDGCGVRGMRERAALAGGELTVSSSPGRGSEIALSLPLPVP